MAMLGFLGNQVPKACSAIRIRPDRDEWQCRLPCVTTASALSVPSTSSPVYAAIRIKGLYLQLRLLRGDGRRPRGLRRGCAGRLVGIDEPGIPEMDMLPFL